MSDAGSTSGPFRDVQDQELKPIWYLKPQTSYLMEFIPITAYPPPGFDAPAVLPLLRRMIWLVRLTPRDFASLIEDVQAELAGRELIAIRARLMAELRQVYESPWAFPAVIETADLLRLRKLVKGVADGTTLPANITASTPAVIAISYLSRFAGTAVGHAAYMASLTNRFYSAHQQNIDTELALRGISPEVIPQ